MLSVVTVELCDFEAVIRTSNSLESLNFDYEQIVIVSNMNLFNKLQSIKKSYPKMSIHFVAPEGVYPAMNVGASKAKYKWLLFLNAGDELVSQLGFLSNVRSDQFDIIFGRFKKENRLFNVKPDWYIKVGMPTSHQAMIFATNQFTEYSVRYKLSSDYEYVVRSIIDNVRIFKVNTIISQNETHGLSSNKMLILQEYAQIIRVNFGFMYVPLIYFRILMQLILSTTRRIFLRTN